MDDQSFYSIQTLLAYEIQKSIFRNHYLYVAVDFEAVGNHPTSRPRLLVEQWCRVASGRGEADDLVQWERNKNKLLMALLDAYDKGRISAEQLDDGQNRVANASDEMASPVRIVISRKTYTYEVRKGDSHAGYEQTEEEYLLVDLPPTADFEVEQIDCQEAQH